MSDEIDKAVETGDLWVMIRMLLSQGGDIYCDRMRSKNGSYEEYSARLDAAAAERVGWFREELSRRTRQRQ